MVKQSRVHPVHVVGAAATEFVAEHEAMLDELVFDVVHRALRECGLRKPDIGLSVLASLDVYDGRSISSGLTSSATGGYLSDAFRVEDDMGAAIIAAAQAVSAGDVSVAVAVGVHNPENRAATRHGFIEQISNLSFDPHFGRPVGLTAEVTYGLHASTVTADGTLTVDDLAAAAAEQITAGAGGVRAMRRAPVGVADVLASPRVCTPLHELMLPAMCAGAVAVVLASPARAGRCLGRDARLTGFGGATGGYLWDDGWLTDPAETTRRAAGLAYAQAGIDRPADRVGVVEYSAVTAALDGPVSAALGCGSPRRVNPGGGVLSAYPGVANGGLRLIELVDVLGTGETGVSHSVDTVSGLVAQNASVLVVEGL